MAAPALTAAACIAALRFERDHGRLPVSIGEICPSYMQFVPLDPFGHGRPLIMKTNSQGLAIYSTGLNREDNRGDADTDVVFRVIDRNAGRVAK